MCVLKVSGVQIVITWKLDSCNQSKNDLKTRIILNVGKLSYLILKHQTSNIQGRKT